LFLSAPTPQQKEAAALKDEGTAAYKKKDFAKALELYTKASERMPTDMVYLLNKGKAWHFMCALPNFLVVNVSKFNRHSHTHPFQARSTLR
jgi:hypothetical protein